MCHCRVGSVLRRVAFTESRTADTAVAHGLRNARPDRDWSLSDCTSFVIMGARDLTDALTGDHHFEQAGFVAMLK